MFLATNDFSSATDKILDEAQDNPAITITELINIIPESQRDMIRSAMISSILRGLENGVSVHDSTTTNDMGLRSDEVDAIGRWVSSLYSIDLISSSPIRRMHDVVMYELLHYPRVNAILVRWTTRADMNHWTYTHDISHLNWSIDPDFAIRIRAFRRMLRIRHQWKPHVLIFQESHAEWQRLILQRVPKHTLHAQAMESRKLSDMVVKGFLRPETEENVEGIVKLLMDSVVWKYGCCIEGLVVRISDFIEYLGLGHTPQYTEGLMTELIYVCNSPFMKESGNTYTMIYDHAGRQFLTCKIKGIGTTYSDEMLENDWIWDHQVAVPCFE